MIRNRISILTVIFIALLFVGCSQTGTDLETDEETAIAVETGEIIQGDFFIEKKINGTIKPQKQTPVLIVNPGEVESLKVENSERIEEDNHIATIKTSMGKQKIFAPMDGIVSMLKVHEGEFQTTDSPIMTIIDMEKVYADFSVTASLRELIDTEKKVSVMIVGESFKGTVLPLDLSPNEQGQYPITVVINNGDNEFLPGMTTTMKLKEVVEEDTIIIPTASIITGTSDDYVYILQGDTAKKVTVDILATKTGVTAVNGSLSKDDLIIVKGQYFVADGSPVIVKDGYDK